jgi:hypothetical protein
MQERLSITEGRKILKHDALEHEVQSAIVEYLEFQKMHFSVTNAAEAYNEDGGRIQRVYPAGTSDLQACTPQGRYFAIECKRAIGGVLSYEQAVFLDRAWKMGGLVCIARSVDDVIAVLIHGVRQTDLGEIAVALAKGPDIKSMIRRRERNTRRKLQGRAKVWRS